MAMSIGRVNIVIRMRRSILVDMRRMYLALIHA